MTDDQNQHQHQWARLGALEVCTGEGCSAHRATTQAAENALIKLGDADREPMKGQS